MQGEQGGIRFNVREDFECVKGGTDVGGVGEIQGYCGMLFIDVKNSVWAIVSWHELSHPFLALGLVFFTLMKS